MFMEALLKIQCDLSGADYALFWNNVNDIIKVSAKYENPSKADTILNANSSTFSEECLDIVLNSSSKSCVTVALAEKNKEPNLMNNVQSYDWFVRRELSKKHGINSICFVQGPDGGVIEFGSRKIKWDKNLWNCKIPRNNIVDSIKSGASYIIVWKPNPPDYEMVSSFILPSWNGELVKTFGHDNDFFAASNRIRIPVTSNSLSGHSLQMNQIVEIM